MTTFLFLVAWLTFWGPLIAAVDGGSGLIVSLVYLTGDVGMFTTAAFVLVRAGAELRSPLALLAVGVVCVTVSGGLIVVGWLVGLLFIAVAAGDGLFRTGLTELGAALPLRLGIDGGALCASSIRLWCSGFRLSDGDGADIPARAAALALIAAALVRRYVVVKKACGR